MLKSTRSYFIFFSLLFCVGLAFAQNETARFEAANKAYISHDYEKAITLYEEIEAEGLESLSLYYNLGNSYYKVGQTAKSILNYERALRIDPGFEDATYNLRLANLKVIDNIDPLPELMLVSWSKSIFRGLSSGQWSILSISLIWLSLIAAAVFLFVKIPLFKRISFFAGLLLFLMGIASTEIGFARKQTELNTQYGIIGQRTAYIKNSPDGDQDLLVLHEGAKVEILENTGDWSRVHIKGVGIDVVGFVKRAELLEI